MWKITKTPTTNLFLQLTLTFVFTILLWDTALALSDKRLCADEKCKEIISLGKGKINYRAGAEGMVSFKINSPIRIKSKSAGSDQSLWGIEVNGREGYAPKNYIREDKILIGEKNLKFEVDVIKPGSSAPEVEPHILNSSEVVQETTTTKPLEALPVDSKEESIVSSPVENVSNAFPQAATPVQGDSIFVDGTRIPTLNDGDDAANVVDEDTEEQQGKASSTFAMTKDNDDDDGSEDDDEIGDYDEDEEEENSKEEVATNTMPLEATPLSANTDNNLKNSQETAQNENTNSTNANNVAEEVMNVIADDVVETTTTSPLADVEAETTTTSPNADVVAKTTTTLPVAGGNYLPPTEKPIVESEAVTESVPVLEEPSNKIPENNQTLAENEENSSVSINSADETKSQSQGEQQNQQVPTDEKTETGSVQENATGSVQENTTGSVQENTTVNESSDFVLPTANEEANISSEPSLPDNRTIDVITSENTLPIASSTEENEQDSKEEIHVSDNIEHVQPNAGQSDSPVTPTLSSELPVDNTAAQSQESENLSVNQYPYSVPTKTQDVNNNPESTQTATQTESPPTETQTAPPNNDPYNQNTNNYVAPSHFNPYDNVESSNTPLPPQYDYNNPTESSTTDTPHYDYNDQPSAGYMPTELVPEATTMKPPYIAATDIPMVVQSEVSTAKPEEQVSDSDPYEEIKYGQGIVEPLQPLVTPEPPKEEEPKTLPSLTPSFSTEEVEKKDNKGLFATIMETVNNILPNNKKPKYSSHDAADENDELNRILYPGLHDQHHDHKTSQDEEAASHFCEKLGPNECPYGTNKEKPSTEECTCSLKTLITTEFTFETFAQALAAKVLEISDLLAFLSIVAAATLFFIFGYYCFCNSSNEGALLSKLNQLESSLLASHKENAILKHNLMSTRQKLVSIEDNSFGSNDMVVSIKKELEEELVEKARLQEQITALQKELENAADAGIELNKIVSELLSNQTGDESIISSVEELQKQLNEQQNTILEINASLAEKSRENSELQLLIAEQNARYELEISNLQRDNDELEAEKGNLRSRLEEIKNDFDKDITAALEGKNFEIKRLQNEIVELSTNVEGEHTKWQTSMAKVEALEECLKNVKRDPNVNITQVIDAANIRAELLDAQKKSKALKERLELELDARKLSENQLQIVTAEVEKLKQDFNQSEKDKLEAQTRLEVLSNYFKDKETQLQKELSLKETMWLQQQGETTTTVDRLTAMQEEIQSLKSQNDALRAEIEAQVAAHKAQTGTLENRAHETWLAARQSDRRYEEARAEATALRRKLTALAGGNVNEANKPSAGSAGLGDDLTNAPSPIHMESPGSPMLGRMPPPPFLPPPFMGPPPPFMGMPPPPFVPPGELRPAPLGRIMSPPPPQRSGLMDYDDYMDYEGNNSWHRHHTYSPPPRTYRSLSPTDSRYNYGTERDLMSTYDTETDFSPPPSPRETRRRGGYDSDKGGSKNPYNNSKKSSSGPKGNISSGSDKSYNSSSKHGHGGSKSKSSGGGKSLV